MNKKFADFALGCLFRELQRGRMSYLEAIRYAIAKYEGGEIDSETMLQTIKKFTDYALKTA